MNELSIREYNSGKERSCTSCKSFKCTKEGETIALYCTKHGVSIKRYNTCEANERAGYEEILYKADFLEKYYHLREV